VADQRHVHLARSGRSTGSDRTDLVDRSVRVVVLPEIEGSPTLCRQTHLCQRLQLEMIAMNTRIRQSMAACCTSLTIIKAHTQRHN